MTKIILGMSGGVDSSVCAYLLKKEGFDVIGVSFQLYDGQELSKAQEIADLLKIKFSIVDKRHVFCKKVLQYFKETYLNGQTPNPCVVCNKLLKFHSLAEIADTERAHFIATGHYANVENGLLFKGFDTNKDQSYFLCNLPQSLLQRIKFPLGKLLKSEVKSLAVDLNFQFSGIKESNDICFLKGENYKKIFIQQDNQIEVGNFIDENNNILGEHSGINNYTIGQRKGIGIAYKFPLYIKKINKTDNTITLSNFENLKVAKIYVEQINNLCVKSQEILNAEIKFRYTKNSAIGDIFFTSDFANCIIKLKTAEYAIAPGQFCVAYEGNKVLFGGIIKSFE